MSKPEAASYALAACVEYDRLMTLVKTLTHDITACACPREEINEVGFSVGGPSCFQLAKVDEKLAVREYPYEPAMQPPLATIAQAVADCPSCSRLCELIAARMQARKDLGIARRKLRYAARKVRGAA